MRGTANRFGIGVTRPTHRAETWRQDRHRNDQPAQTAHEGELLHHAFEAERGGADVVDAGRFSFEGSRQIGEDVAQIATTQLGPWPAFAEDRLLHQGSVIPHRGDEVGVRAGHVGHGQVGSFVRALTAGVTLGAGAVGEHPCSPRGVARRIAVR